MTARTLRQIIGVNPASICSVCAGTPALGVAKQLRGALTVAGSTPRTDIEDEDDPLEVFRAAAQISPDAAASAQQLLTVFETAPSRPRGPPEAQPT